MSAQDQQPHSPGRESTWNTASERWVIRALRPLLGLAGPHGALLLLLTFGGGIAAVLTVVSAEVYEAVVASNGVAALDHPALELALSLRKPWLDVLVTGYTTIGGPIGMPILTIMALVALAVTSRSWTPALLVATASLGSLLMTIAAKQAIGRMRPPVDAAVPPFEISPSFPSGHSLNALVISGIVAYVLVLRQQRRRTRILTVASAALFALTMGLSRVYLGHHWFTDVLVAWTLGLAWLAVVITAHRLLRMTWARRAQSGNQRPVRDFR